MSTRGRRSVSTKGNQNSNLIKPVTALQMTQVQVDRRKKN